MTNIRPAQRAKTPEPAQANGHTMRQPADEPLMAFILTLLTPFLMSPGLPILHPTDAHPTDANPTDAHPAAEPRPTVAARLIADARPIAEPCGIANAQPTDARSAAAVHAIAEARLAAAQIIAAYQPAGSNQLINVAQVVAFAVTAIDNLRLSLPPDLSLSMKLKLRGNANALNRSARDNPHRLDAHRPNAHRPNAHRPNAHRPDVTTGDRRPNAHRPNAHRPDVTTGDRLPLSPSIASSTSPDPTPTDEPRDNSLQWASAMTSQAAELRANAPHLPPAEQTRNSLWIDVLTGVANDLTLGKNPIAAPGMSRSQLMRTTLMTSGAQFLTGSTRSRANTGP
jgi:hypothetical protein